MAKPRFVVVRGLCVYLASKNNLNRDYVHKRKLVSPEWVNVWYLINSGEFDDNLFISLNQIDRDFLAYCVHQTGVHNIEFEKALARNYRSVLERMRVLEGSIKAGNINREIVDEFKQVVDRLIASWQISGRMGNNLKRQIERTYEHASNIKNE